MKKDFPFVWLEILCIYRDSWGGGGISSRVLHRSSEETVIPESSEEYLSELTILIFR